MPPRYWILLALALAAFLLLMKAAGADEATARWFKSLTQPGSGVSCCDISDCRPTRSEWRDGRWWAESMAR